MDNNIQNKINNFPNSFQDSGYDSYLMLDLIKNENNIDEKIINIIKMFYNDEFDDKKIINCVLYFDEIGKCLLLTAIKEICLINKSEIIENLYKTITDRYNQNGTIFIEDSEIDNIYNYYKEQGYNYNFQDSYNSEILKEQLKNISDIYEKIKKIVNTSEYKIYFDYIYCLKDEYGNNLVDNKEFLKNEIDIYEKIKIQLKISNNKMLNDLPNVKKTFINMPSIPPSIVKNLPQVPCSFIISIIDKIEIILNFFIEKNLDNKKNQE